MSDKTIVVELSTPMLVAGKEVSRLQLRPPRIRDLEKMETAKGGNIAKTIGLIANLAEVSPDEIRDGLAPKDLGAINEALAPFLPGESPSAN